MTFEIDANGILNVTAVDQTTGKSNKITIKNEKGRLSEKEIERMLEEAKRMEAEDKANLERITAKNNLEAYAFSLQNSIQDQKVAEKLSPEDKQSLEKAIDDTLKWIDANPRAEKDEYESKRRELEGIANPIMTRTFGGGAPGGGFTPGAAPEAGAEPKQEPPKPTFTEMDVD